MADLAILAAERAEASGQIFNVSSSEAVSWKEFFCTLAGCLGTRLPRTHVPASMAYVGAAVLETVWKAAGKTGPPPATRFGVRLLSAHRQYNHSGDPRFPRANLPQGRIAENARVDAPGKDRRLAVTGIADMLGEAALMTVLLGAIVVGQLVASKSMYCHSQAVARRDLTEMLVVDPDARRSLRAIIGGLDTDPPAYHLLPAPVSSASLAGRGRE